MEENKTCSSCRYFRQHYVRLARNRFDPIPCGHCGDGNIHTEMLRGPEMSDEEWKSATHASLKELYALSKELGGQLSGEHGIGNGRLEFLEEFVGPRMIALYKAIKLAFDDKLILNPGKVIEFQQNKQEGNPV